MPSNVSTAPLVLPAYDPQVVDTAPVGNAEFVGAGDGDDGPAPGDAEAAGDDEPPGDAEALEAAFGDAVVDVAPPDGDADAALDGEALDGEALATMSAGAPDVPPPQAASNEAATNASASRA